MNPSFFHNCKMFKQNDSMGDSRKWDEETRCDCWIRMTINEPTLISLMNEFLPITLWRWYLGASSLGLMNSSEGTRIEGKIRASDSHHYLWHFVIGSAVPKLNWYFIIAKDFEGVYTSSRTLFLVRLKCLYPSRAFRSSGDPVEVASDDSHSPPSPPWKYPLVLSYGTMLEHWNHRSFLKR